MSAPAKAKPKTKNTKCNVDTLDAAFVAVARLGAGGGMSKDDVIGYVVALFLHILATSIVFIVMIAVRATALQKSRLGHVGPAFDLRVASLANLMNKPLNTTMPYFQDEKNLTSGVVIQTGATILKSFEKLCSGEETHEWLHYLMFFLWISFIGPKLIDAFFRMQVLVQIPTGCPDAADQEISKKGVALTSIDCVSKLLVFFVVVLPHTLANLLAAWVGLQFLAMEAAVGTLLMKALIMKVVTTIEAPVFKNFATKGLSGCMKKSTFNLPGTEGAKEDKASLYYNTWGATILKFLIFFLVGVIYYKMQWSGLLTYRNNCSLLMAKMGTDSVRIRCIAHGIPGNSCGVD